MKTSDPKFQRWLGMVSPEQNKTQQILTAVDWNVVLQLLLKIFEILLGLGCFGRASVTRKVRKALLMNEASAQVELQFILDDLTKGK